MASAQKASMAPALQRLVEESVSLHLHENAVFYAERLFAESPGMDTLHTLAQVYLSSGDTGHAYRTLRHYYPFADSFPRVGDHQQHLHHLHRLLYLYAVCLIRIHRYQDAEHVLRSLIDLQREVGSPAEHAATHHWFGVVLKRTNRIELGRQWFEKSFSTNPFGWCTLEALHSAGVKDDHLDDLLAPSKAPQYTADFFGGVVASAPPAAPSTPPAPSASLTTPVKSKKSVPTPGGLAAAAHGLPYTSPKTTTAKKRANTLCGTPATKRGRDCDEKEPAVPLEGCVSTLMQSMTKWGAVLRSVLSYCYDEAVRLLDCLPPAQQASGYFQSLLASAHYCEGHYSLACEVFAAIRAKEPYRLDSRFTYYSSCLWQLHRDKQLGQLAQEMVEMDRFSPVTQVVLGNAHSVVGEHDTALKFLKRACLMDRYHAYAFTLRGMEHLVLDELNDATQCFRTAISLEPKMYAAWHGLGSVDLKQDKYETAKFHFHKAMEVNRSAPIVLAYAQAVQEEKQPNSLSIALSAVESVLSRQPTHLLAKLRRAELLVKAKAYPRAIQDLEELREQAPREARVFITLGKVYKKVKNRMKALEYFNLAMGLEPKENPFIKSEIDKLQEGEPED